MQDLDPTVFQKGGIDAIQPIDIGITSILDGLPVKPKRLLHGGGCVCVGVGGSKGSGAVEAEVVGFLHGLGEEGRVEHDLCVLCVCK